MIYLDNSATTKPYAEVLDTYRTVSEQFFANPSSLHSLGGKSEQLLTRSREQAAALLGVEPGEIVFTSGGTEGNNLAIKGAAFAYRKRGKHLITTAIEHASAGGAFTQLESLGFDVTYLPVDRDGRVSFEQFKQAYRDDTILVSLMHVNNEVGTVQPVKEIAAFCVISRKRSFMSIMFKASLKYLCNSRKAGLICAPFPVTNSTDQREPDCFMFDKALCCRRFLPAAVRNISADQAPRIYRAFAAWLRHCASRVNMKMKASAI